MNLHEQRIAELRQAYRNGRVAEHIYFNKSKARFRVKIGGEWIGTFWTFKGAVSANDGRDGILINLSSSRIGLFWLWLF